MSVEDIAGSCIGNLFEFFIYDVIAAPGRLLRYVVLKLTFQEVDWWKLSGHQQGKMGDRQARWNVLLGLAVYLGIILWFSV